MLEKVSSDLHLVDSVQPVHLCRSESSSTPFWIAKDANFLHADNENSADCEILIV